MSKMPCRIAGALLLAAISAADAAPNIPPSELPGRERQRFQDSPVDRFTQPGTQQQQPLWRQECERARTKAGQQRRAKTKRC